MFRTCADAGRLADTEIDWQAYMEQVAQYLAGERDYARIKGGTGPLVYPGAHVYIYRGLYALTHEGRDIRLAQIAFAGLYVAALVVTMACYRLAKVSIPPCPIGFLSCRNIVSNLLSHMPFETTFLAIMILLPRPSIMELT